MILSDKPFFWCLMLYFQHFQTKEPATCLNQIGSKILIGAEKFLVYDLRQGDVDGMSIDD